MNGNDLIEFEENNYSQLIKDFLEKNPEIEAEMIAVMLQKHKEKWNKFLLEEYNNDKI